MQRWSSAHACLNDAVVVICSKRGRRIGPSGPTVEELVAQREARKPAPSEVHRLEQRIDERLKRLEKAEGRFKSAEQLTS